VAAAEPSALDPETIRELTELMGDDSDALAEIAEAFLEEGADRVGELQRGAAANDQVLVGRAAHTLKANALTFGAARLASVCQETEAAARAGDLSAACARIPEIEELWVGVSAELSALCERTAH
jgi:HPt (histidine-containing phosphotransfer) domain-containing protein